MRQMSEESYTSKKLRDGGAKAVGNIDALRHPAEHDSSAGSDLGSRIVEPNK
jgi:hypothetical protein